MDGVKVDEGTAAAAHEGAMRRDDEAHKRFLDAFEKLVAGGEPGDGVTRMQRLEEITRQLRTELDSSVLTYVSGMIDAIDEGEAIASRGPSSSGAASS